MRGTADPREAPARRSDKAAPGPLPTIAELGAHVDWYWLVCGGCGRQTAIRLALLVDRFGADASSNIIRQSARCTACGHKGAMLQHPIWMGSHGGWQTFPEAVSAVE